MTTELSDFCDKVGKTKIDLKGCSIYLEIDSDSTFQIRIHSTTQEQFERFQEFTESRYIGDGKNLLSLTLLAKVRVFHNRE